MSQQDTKNFTDSAIAAGAALADVRNVGNTPYAVVPQGYSLQNLEKMMGAPVRQRGVTELFDEVSFIQVVNDRKNVATRIYSRLAPTPVFVAVFNGPDGQTTGWGDNRASYLPPLSPEWLIWNEWSGKPRSQVDFGLFLETNLPDIAEPAGAVLLEMTNTFEAKKKVNFASSQRLSNGETQFTYEETVEGTSNKGQMVVPETFVLAIPVFENGEPWKVEAKLRYRISDGKLSIWYELVRPQKIVEVVLREMRERICSATDVAVLNGSLNQVS